MNVAEKGCFRIGKISSFDYPKGTAKITYEDKNDSTTAFFSFLAFQYWMPKVGDQVMVAHLSNGTCAATILGPVWHDGHRPPEGFEGLYRKEYSNDTGKAYQRYDAKAGEYSETITGTMTIKPTDTWKLQTGATTITVNPDGSVAISAPTGVTIDTSVVTVTGDVVAGGISLQKHTHTGVHGETSPAH